MKRMPWLAIALVLLPISAWSDGNNYGSSVYLRQGVGARALGMGGAFVALADDATAGYWNPAGLAQMDLYMYEVGSQYAVLSNQMSSSYLSYAFQWPEVGNLELGWINFNSGEIEKRDENGLVAGTFINAENAIFLSYGRKTFEWVKGLSLGASLKYLHQGMDGFTAVGHGLDIGALWQPVLYLDHTIGLNVQNVFQRLYWNVAENSMDFTPLNVKLGTSLKFFPSQDRMYFNHLVTALDIEFSEYSRFNFRLGAEYWFIQNLAARLGYDGQGITAGASYSSEYYEVDYAFRYDPGELQAHQHRVSLMLRIPGEGSGTLRQLVPTEIASTSEEPMTPAPTPIPTPATPAPTPQPTPATPEPTQTPTPEPTQKTADATPVIMAQITSEKATPAKPEVKTETELKSGPVLKSHMESLEKPNALTINPLGLFSFSNWSGISLELEYERALTSEFSAAVKGLLTIRSGSNGVSSYSNLIYGAGLSGRYYLPHDGKKYSGFWMGPIIKYQLGELGGSLFNEELATMKATVLTIGAEVGYKILLGKNDWFVLSPYLGLYNLTATNGSIKGPDMDIKSSLSVSLTYPGVGVNVGIAF
ncbi:MAG: PorV/PorQ family protein [candidate division FCPU426 bacterium]